MKWNFRLKRLHFDYNAIKIWLNYGVRYDGVEDYDRALGRKTENVEPFPISLLTETSPLFA